VEAAIRCYDAMWIHSGLGYSSQWIIRQSYTTKYISEQSSKIEAGVENDESVHPFFLHCSANPHGKRVATLKPAFVDARGKEQHKKPIKAINSDST